MGVVGMRNVPYTTLYPCRREKVRVTRVEHVELLKAVGKVGLAAILKARSRRTEQADKKRSLKL